MKTNAQAALWGLAVSLAACQSEPPAAQAPPENIARPASAVVTQPAPLPNAAVDVGPALQQLLPPQGYLKADSIQTVSVTPIVAELPPLWGALGPGASRVAPAYRIAYRARLRWQPTGYSRPQDIPTKETLYVPDKDTLALYALGGASPLTPDPGRHRTIEIRPYEAVEVAGTVYAYTTHDKEGKPALVAYPYRHKDRVASLNQMVFIALPNQGQ